MKMWKILVAIICAVIVFFAVLYILTPRGSITGEFVRGGHKGFGNTCGSYPSTYIVLKNYTVTGDYELFGNEFYFGNEFSDIDNLKVGQRIKINYHQESRQSDTTPSTTGYYWVIDSIEIL